MTDYRKFTHSIVRLILLMAILPWATNIRAQEDPDIVILANSSTGIVNLKPTDDLFIEIELDPFSIAGDSADWWVIADVGVGFYYYNLVTSLWMEGIGLGNQAPLVDFEFLEILDLPSPLPVGTFTFYFGVDTIPNGELDVLETNSPRTLNS